MSAREAPALLVPRALAETARARLAEAGCLARDLQPARHGERVAFPLAPLDEAQSGAVARIVDALSPAELGVAAFATRQREPDSYQQLLDDLPADARRALPSAFDVVGDIAVIKLFDEMKPYAPRIAQALLTVHSRLRTVALDEGVQGTHRVRKLSVIRGDPNLSTEHREHGLRLRVPLDQVYFSPRLATERARLAARIQPGARVLDMFAGVGALVCLVARDRKPATVHAIDLNRAAVAALEANLVRNKLDAARVVATTGDARDCAPRTADFDHVIMNLPHGAIDFLDVATACVAAQGEIHLYAMVDQADRATFEAHLVRKANAHLTNEWVIRETRHVRTYAPTIAGLAYTLGPARA